jgi:hypothetical protein
LARLGQLTVFAAACGALENHSAQGRRNVIHG